MRKALIQNILPVIILQHIPNRLKGVPSVNTTLQGIFYHDNAYCIGRMPLDFMCGIFRGIVHWIINYFDIIQQNYASEPGENDSMALLSSTLQSLLSRVFRL